MNEKRFLELFPEIDDYNGIWKKKKTREEKEKSQKKMEEAEQKNQKQREEFFAHIKMQIQPNKQWKLPKNAELSRYKDTQKKCQSFDIMKKVIVYAATAAACLILVIILPNLSDFLKMSGQQEQDVLKQETDYDKQKTIVNEVSTSEDTDIFNQKTDDEKKSEKTQENDSENNSKKNSNNKKNDSKDKNNIKDIEQNKVSSKNKETNTNDQEQILKQETKDIKDFNQKEKENNTNKLDSDSKKADKDNKGNGELSLDNIESDSLVPESFPGEGIDSLVPESFPGETIDIPTMGNPEENSFPANEIASATTEDTEDTENIENELLASAGNIVSEPISESVANNTTTEESSEAAVDTSAIDISSAFEYALMKGEGREISLEKEEELSRIEIEQELKNYPYLYYKENDKEVWYQSTQETIEAIDEKELLGTAYIFKEKTAIGNTDLEISIYGNTENLSFIFIRFFAEGVYWYYGYQEYQE